MKKEWDVNIAPWTETRFQHAKSEGGMAPEAENLWDSAN